MRDVFQLLFVCFVLFVVFFIIIIIREESNGQLRMTKCSKIVLEIVRFFFPMNRGNNCYMLTIQTVLGGGGNKNNVLLSSLEGLKGSSDQF